MLELLVWALNLPGLLREAPTTVIAAVVLGVVVCIGMELEDRAKERLLKLSKEGRLPEPWEYYVNEYERRLRCWKLIEAKVQPKLTVQDDSSRRSNRGQEARGKEA